MEKRKVSVDELERLIEQHIFNRIPCDHWHYIHLDAFYWMRSDTCPHAAGECYWSKQTPLYTRDANANRMVVKALRAKGFDWLLRDEISTGAYARFIPNLGEYRIYHGTHTDALIATCLAALATKGIFVEVE